MAQIAEAYRTAPLALRLPMHGGFDAFETIVDLPFVARRSARDPDDTRRALGLPLGERLVLVSFGGYGVDGLSHDALARLEGYVAVVSGSDTASEVPDGLQARTQAASVFVDESRMYADGFRYEDLVRAVDVVATKPGYGIISECLANDTALLYTSRGDFIEYDVLVEAMPRFLRSAFIGHDDLFAGDWTAASRRASGASRAARASRDRWRRCRGCSASRDDLRAPNAAAAASQQSRSPTASRIVVTVLQHFGRR